VQASGAERGPRAVRSQSNLSTYPPVNRDAQVLRSGARTAHLAIVIILQLQLGLEKANARTDKRSGAQPPVPTLGRSALRYGVPSRRG
jgi:hypothetical protein